MKSAWASAATRSSEPLPKLWLLPLWGGTNILRGGMLVGAVCLVLMIYADRAVLLFVREWNFPFRGFLEGLTHLGNSALYLIPMFLLAVTLSKASTLLSVGNRKLFFQRLYRQVLFLFTSIAVSGLCTDLIKIVLGRPRPRQFLQGETANFLFFQLSSKMWSFPSGHANTVFALATALALLFPKTRLIAFPLAMLVAISRIFTGSHYPSDILAGAFIGVATTIYLRHCFNRKDGSAMFKCSPESYAAISSAGRN